MNILMESDVILNTDLGLLRYIKKEFCNDKYIDVKSLDIVLAHTEYLGKRKSRNPLLLVLKDEYAKQADSLYNQFMNEKYNEILKLSPISKADALIKLTIENAEMTLTILCKKLVEQQILKEKYNCKVIVKNSIEIFDTTLYDAVIIKYFSDVKLYKNLIAKTIYISDLRCNFSATKKYQLVPDMYVQMEGPNSIKVFNIY